MDNIALASLTGTERAQRTVDVASMDGAAFSADLLRLINAGGGSAVLQEKLFRETIAAMK